MISQLKPSPWNDMLDPARESAAGYFVLQMLVRGEVEVVVGGRLLLGFVMLLRVKGRLVVWGIGGVRRPGRPSALVWKRMSPSGLLKLSV